MIIWGLIPAAGNGTRIQPLAFSKELLPVGSRFDGLVEKPKAVSEYLVDRMIDGGANKICFVISPNKSDIMRYYGNSIQNAAINYVVQAQPAGLCDALFCAAAFIPKNETILIGLPDTIWFPEDGFNALPDNTLSFLLFEVANPENFDAVVSDEHGAISRIEVKTSAPSSKWIWGAIKVPGFVFHELYRLWELRGRTDEYLGTLVNAWLDDGGQAIGVKAGESYVDVGTLNGYREALRVLTSHPNADG